MRSNWLICLVIGIMLHSANGGRAAEENDKQMKLPWNIEALSVAPKTHPAPGFEAPGVKALFYEGLPFQGKPTRVFAWYGAPPAPPGEKVPAMVLVHGGGGTAFDSWVRLWNARGYAAIAMDLCGSVPGGEHGKRPRHENGGPPGWGGFGQIDWPLTDQWTYHAVADIMLAHSLLRSMPEVDSSRIGVTGISWGGYLTCIASAVDVRFKLAVPVYGCGYLGDNSTWLGEFQKMGPEKAAKWLYWWDPSRYLRATSMPMLWVTGTNDFAYPLDSLQKSYRLPRGRRTLCIRVRMPHGHGGAGENPEEIHAFANSYLKGGRPLPRIEGQGRTGEQVWATYDAGQRVGKAELNYTKDSGQWSQRRWATLPATVDAANRRVTATLPAGARVYYLNLTDEHNLVVSTEHEER